MSSPTHPRRPPQVEHTDGAVERIRQLENALESSRTISRAQGILMERYAMDADAAIAVLKRGSSDLNIKVRDVAAILIETRQLPPPH